MAELGLFPLPLVLVPTERIPLHIFEPRYRELIDECVATDGDFGLVLATGDGAVHEIGTRASVQQVLEVLDDGSMNVIVEGGERFRLLELTKGRAYTTGIVEPVVDLDEPADESDLVRAAELFAALAEVAESDVELPDVDSPTFEFELAARVDFGVDPKQELLASTSPRARVKRLNELLEIAIEAVRLEHTLRERAGLNGKVSPLETDTETASALDDDAGAAAPRVARCGELAARKHLDRVRAAEEEVPPAPAHDVVTHVFEPVELAGVEPSLAVDMRLVDVQ